jgi:hypothetical protein
MARLGGLIGMMIEKLRAFLVTCPFLEIQGDKSAPLVYVDHLTETPSVYSINIIPTQPWVRKYVDGGGVKQLTFVFRSLEVYGGADITQNIQNIAFFERFAEWLEQQVPNTIPELYHWIKVEALTEGYFFDVQEGQDKASYQIQCRVLYTV